MIYSLENEYLQIRVSSLGATLMALIDKKSGRDLVLGFDREEDYLKMRGPYFGATVGRNCGRIKKACFKINNVIYHLLKNDGENNLHSGVGISFSEFNLVEYGVDFLQLMINLADGQDGFPGNMQLTVIYRLIDNKLRIAFKGLCDQDSVFNITNHSYFNLNGEGDILDHELMINTDRVAKNGSDNIANGASERVLNSAYDFQTFQKIGVNLKKGDDNLSGGGLDHNFVFENLAFKKLACLKNEDFLLTLSSDLPGLQVYTANFLGELPGKGGRTYRNYAGVALEPQYYPNALNYEGFLKPLIRANEECYHYIDYKIERNQ